MVKFPTFKGSWPWPWSWFGSYCISSCISRRPLPTYEISLKSKKPFCGRTDGRTFEASFTRWLGGVDLIKGHLYTYLLVVVTTSAAKNPGGPCRNQRHGFMARWYSGTDIDKILVRISVYCLKCMKFGQLILEKIIKNCSHQCQILRLKCTKLYFARPQTLLGELRGVWGLLLRWEMGGKRRGKERQKGRGGKKRKGAVRLLHFKFLDPPLMQSYFFKN